MSTKPCRRTRRLSADEAVIRHFAAQLIEDNTCPRVNLAMQARGLSAWATERRDCRTAAFWRQVATLLEQRLQPTSSYTS